MCVWGGAVRLKCGWDTQSETETGHTLRTVASTKLQYTVHLTLSPDWLSTTAARRAAPRVSAVGTSSGCTGGLLPCNALLPAELVLPMLPTTAKSFAVQVARILGGCASVGSGRLMEDIPTAGSPGGSGGGAGSGTVTLLSGGSCQGMACCDDCR
jgi:hypothetical protein